MRPLILFEISLDAVYGVLSAQTHAINSVKADFKEY